MKLRLATTAKLTLLLDLFAALLVVSLGLGVLAFIPTGLRPALKPQQATLGEEFTLKLRQTPMEITRRWAVPGKS